jgi:hypothetical protein
MTINDYQWFLITKWSEPTFSKLPEGGEHIPSEGVSLKELQQVYKQTDSWFPCQYGSQNRPGIYEIATPSACTTL